MKQLFPVSLAVLALSLAISAQQNIDLDVNGVNVVTTEAEVIQKFGTPSSKKSVEGDECQGSLRRLRYPGFTLEMADGDADGKSVMATVAVTSPKWSVSGIKIGASIGEVRKRFGTGKSERKKGLDYRNYVIGEGYADFVFRKGKLIKIYWAFNFC